MKEFIKFIIECVAKDKGVKVDVTVKERGDEDRAISASEGCTCGDGKSESGRILP